MVIERVTAVQHPTVAGVDSDAVMAAGMAGHRDEDYPFRDLIEFLGRGDPPATSLRPRCARRSSGCAPTRLDGSESTHWAVQNLSHLSRTAPAALDGGRTGDELVERRGISGQLRAGCECGRSSGVVNHFAPLIAGPIDRSGGGLEGRRTDKAEYLLPHFQLIAHLGACGKTRVMPQNGWPKPELTESGVAKCVSCWRRMSRAERSNRHPAMRWWSPEAARQG